MSSTHHGSSPLHLVLDDEHLSQARRVLFLGRAVSLVSSASRSARGTDASLFSTFIRSGLIATSISVTEDCRDDGSASGRSRLCGMKGWIREEPKLVEGSGR